MTGKRTQGSKAATVDKSTRREFIFQDGSSNKFWNIDLDGSSHTVTFGRIGTNGQQATKDFPDEAKALKSYEKLIAEKLGKGYTEVGGSKGSKSSATPAPKSKSAAKTPATAKSPPAAKTNGKPDAKAPAAKTPAAAEINLDTKRSIALDPRDWYRAAFRNLPPLERGTPRPFDVSQCLEILSRLLTKHGIEWEILELPAALSRQEAQFWFEAMTADIGDKEDLQKFAKAAEKKKYDAKHSMAAIEKAVKESYFDTIVVLPISNLVSVEEIAEHLVTRRPSSKSLDDSDIAVLLEGFREWVLPFLSEKERAALKTLVRKHWKPVKFPDDTDKAFPVPCYFAAMLGMHDEVEQAVSTMPEKRYNTWNAYTQWPQTLVVGLAAPEQIASEFRRLTLSFRTDGIIRGFLACTEYSALDYLAGAIKVETNKERSAELVKLLGLVHAPETAEPMLDCMLSSKAPQVAREWLDRNVGVAIAGLVKTAAGKGKLAEAAAEYLRKAKALDHGDLIAKCLKSIKDSPGAKGVESQVLDFKQKEYKSFDAKSTPKWLKKELDAATKMKPKGGLPSWASPLTLPPLPVENFRLNDEQVATVLNVLATTSVTQSHSLLKALREHVQPADRDAFAWKLFDNWSQDGYPTKDKWAMASIGHLGDTGCVLKLTPMIKIWPGESQHPRAVLGLECLRAIGTDTALMQLAGIAQKLKFKGLKAKAETFVSEIANERGMTRAELEDRVIPDCGLDENGKREFSFGSRSFWFALGKELKANVRDDSGKLKPDLPQPGAKDNRELANAAIAEWKLMKKQIKEVGRIQADRLEQSMVTGRHWTVADFETLLVKHPLMSHLVRQLLWAAYDKADKRVLTFRVADERDYADASDKPVSLGKATTVGIVHPLELSEKERSAWGESFSDYEIVSPFPQLGRAVYALEKGEQKQDTFKRFQKTKLPAPSMVYTLEKLGWARGPAMDGGSFNEHSKYFPAADVTAVVIYDGVVAMGWINAEEDLTITNCQFASGKRSPSWGDDKVKKALKFSKVPAIVLSEVLADLHVLKGKSK